MSDRQDEAAQAAEAPAHEPYASGRPQAATPVEALRDKIAEFLWDDMGSGYSDLEHAPQRKQAYWRDYAQRLLDDSGLLADRDRLAAGNEQLLADLLDTERVDAEIVREVTAERDAARAENERLRAARTRVAGIADRWGAIGGDLGTCARQLREALEGDHA